MPAPVITLTSNVGNGTQALVTLAAAPTGTLTFFASTNPAVIGNACVKTPAGVNQWTVDIQAAATSNRVPYYITARDSAASPTDSNVVCQWVAWGSVLDEVTLAEMAIHDILQDHQLAIDAALQDRMGSKVYPSGNPIEVAQIVRGLPYAGHDRYPLISLRVSNYTQDTNMTAGSSDYCPMSGTIYVYEFHQGNTPREHVVQAIGMAVVDLLNMNQHRELPLANGHTLQESLAASVETNEITDQELGLWYAISEIKWIGNVTRGRVA